MPPLQLNTFVNFVDLDPLAPGQQVASFLSEWNPATAQYFGRSGAGSDRLELTMIRKTDPNFYDALLRVWDAFRTGEPFNFLNVFVNPDLPFDTGQFGEVIISGTDFRTLQLME